MKNKNDYLIITADSETYTLEYKVKSVNVLKFVMLIARAATKIAKEAKKDLQQKSVLKFKSLHNRLFDKN